MTQLTRRWSPIVALKAHRRLATLAPPSFRRPGERRSDASRNVALSNIEKHGLVFALQANVETIDRVAIARFAPGDQGVVAIGGHQRQHGIGGIACLSLEVNARISLEQHAARKHRQEYMRRLRVAV